MLALTRTHTCDVHTYTHTYTHMLCRSAEVWTSRSNRMLSDGNHSRLRARGEATKTCRRERCMLSMMCMQPGPFLCLRRSPRPSRASSLRVVIRWSVQGPPSSSWHPLLLPELRYLSACEADKNGTREEGKGWGGKQATMQPTHHEVFLRYGSLSVCVCVP